MEGLQVFVSSLPLSGEGRLPAIGAMISEMSFHREKTRHSIAIFLDEISFRLMGSRTALELWPRGSLIL
jgi:hypothetical protein